MKTEQKQSGHFISKNPESDHTQNVGNNKTEFIKQKNSLLTVINVNNNN